MTEYTADADSLTDTHVERYRRAGFLRVRGLLSGDEVVRFRGAAEALMARVEARSPDSTVFRQYVNAWRLEPDLEGLTRHARIGRIATRLTGTPLRLWHDHLLVKEPEISTPTEFHQDQPYWPHADSAEPISCWVALNDVTVERGCMTFLPGSRRYANLSAQDLRDASSLFSLAPELAWEERVTLPLRAGDCTFHHGRCAHMANANVSDEHRFGFAIVYVDRGTKYTGADHTVTDSLRDTNLLEVGGLLEGELFPPVGA